MGVLGDFKSFVLRGSLIDLAVGFTVGAAFTTVARSLVDDVVMPPLGHAIGGVDFIDMFLVIEDGPKTPGPYASLQNAQEAGAVTLNYGRFVNNVFTLLLVAFAMFMVIRVITRAEARLQARFGPAKTPDQPTTKVCPFCISAVSFEATRCPQCTSALDRPAQQKTSADA